MVNPGTVSAVAAILLYLLEVQLPSLILQPVASIGSTTTPLAMLVIGSSLARQPLREVLQEKSLLPFTLLRLLVLPAAVLLVCRWFLHDPMLLGGAGAGVGHARRIQRRHAVQRTGAGLLLHLQRRVFLHRLFGGHPAADLAAAQRGGLNAALPKSPVRRALNGAPGGTFLHSFSGNGKCR